MEKGLSSFDYSEAMSGITDVFEYSSFVCNIFNNKNLSGRQYLKENRKNGIIKKRNIHLLTWNNKPKWIVNLHHFIEVSIWSLVGLYLIGWLCVFAICYISNGAALLRPG